MKKPKQTVINQLVTITAADANQGLTSKILAKTTGLSIATKPVPGYMLL
jgi:hypothetical protein